jgi:hypothetical protein
MKEKTCPLCGTPLVEDISSSRRDNRTIPSGSLSYNGSIDVYTVADEVKTQTTVYICPNPKCGYLGFDC